MVRRRRDGVHRDRVVEDTSSRADLVARMKKALAHCDDPWRVSAQKAQESDPDALREYTSIDTSGMSQEAPLLTSGGEGRKLMRAERGFHV